MAAQNRSTPLMTSIPTKPTAILCGKLQSKEFTGTVYAVRDALLEVGALQRNAIKNGLSRTEHQQIAAVVERITPLIDRGGDTKAGAIAAVSHWVVMALEGASPSAQEWRPLESTYDGDYDDPHPLASFFEVAGTPVTVTPDLLAQRWTKDRESSEDVSVDLVRAIGKPISRKRFDKLRAKTEPRP